MTKQKQIVTDLTAVVQKMLSEQETANAAYHSAGYSFESESKNRDEISRILNQSIGALNFIITSNGGAEQCAIIETPKECECGHSAGFHFTGSESCEAVAAGHSCYCSGFSPKS